MYCWGALRRGDVSLLGWITALCVATALLYFHQLGSNPPYLSIEEVSQSREALLLATTGRNADGEILPLYFPEDAGRTVRDPVWVYWAALLMQVRPFSETLMRVPSASAGVLNVALMFLVVFKLFDRARPAVIAAILLMLTPAHFQQSRIATMQIAPVTFVLAWLVFIVRYIQTNRRRDAVIAAGCLGAGMYTYVAALVIMPVYFLVTLAIVWRHREPPHPRTVLVATSAAFGIVLIPLAAWFAFHPAQVVGLTGYYTQGEYNKNLGWGGFFGANAISHVDAWWDCYNLDKLFFSGDADFRFSTRTAGFFLLPASVLMAAGVWRAGRLLNADTSILLAAGLLFAPLPAAVVSNSEVKRWLTFLPFAILAATCGAEWMLNHRRRAVQACAIALLVLCGVQTRSFLDEYFGNYRFASGPKLGGNLRGAIHEVFAVSGSGDCVMLDPGIYYLRSQWELYTRASGRLDLAAHTIWLRSGVAETSSSDCRGTTALGYAGDARFAGWPSTPIRELDGTAAFAVYRR